MIANGTLVTQIKKPSYSLWGPGAHQLPIHPVSKSEQFSVSAAMQTENKVPVAVFDGTNFHGWKLRMTLVPDEKNVWSVVGSGSSTATTITANATSGTVGQHSKDVKARRLITSGQTDDHVCHVME